MRKNIVIMNLLVAFFWMTMYSYVPNLPEYARSLGANAVVLGVIGGVYGIAQIILRIPIGATSDKTGKNKLMLQVGMGVLAVSCVILIFCRQYESDHTGQTGRRRGGGLVGCFKRQLCGLPSRRTAGKKRRAF